eukprot:3614014-Prorocentrum_lima.AAC.1
MTSSLVGSEMCIRDRLPAVDSCGQWLACSVASCGQLWTVWLDLLPAAVSYTHLTLPTICSV